MSFKTVGSSQNIKNSIFKVWSLVTFEPAGYAQDAHLILQNKH